MLALPAACSTTIARIMGLPSAGQVCLLAILAILPAAAYHLSRRKKPRKDGRTFRVCGVPLEMDEERLQSLLVEQHNTADPTVRSLALEVHGRSRTATVSFQTTPARRSWQISLPADPNQSIHPRRLTLDDDFLGITTLYNPPPGSHKADVIAVSGLGGHAFGSFKERGGEHMWLRDALPHDITGEGDKKPPARVMVYGHESTLWKSESIQNLEQLGLSFRQTLLQLVSAATLKPIIFVAHSLGGLIVKETLISLSKSKNEDDKKLLQAVYGIVFFGVPHDGMDIQSLIPMVGDKPNRFLLESIGINNSQVLRKQYQEFHEALGKEGQSEVFSFFETVMSPTAIWVWTIWGIRGTWKMSGPSALLVTVSSATHCREWETSEHICPVNRTHSEMVKFGPEDPDYDKALVRIQSLLRRALVAKRSCSRPQLSESAQDCLKSLAFPHMEGRFHEIAAAAAETCQWLGQHQTYQSWLTSDRGLLWIKGKPGSGKSTLLKHALDIHKAGDGDLVLSFFFHGRGDELQKTPLGLFRSLLHQLLRLAPDELSDLVNTFEEKRKGISEPGGKWEWHQGELQRFFELSLPKVLNTRSVWLFVDALDECGKDNAVQDSAVDLVRKFEDLLEKLPPPSSDIKQFRICFSCRHHPILAPTGSLEICLETENREDISTFVDKRLCELQERTLSAIRPLITQHASGVFMWAHFVVKQVLILYRGGAGSKEIKAEISSIPPDLDALYGKLIQGMGPASLKLIQWICCAARPLSIEELRWATVIEPDCQYKSLGAYQSAEDIPDSSQMEKRVLHLSCGLAEVTPSSDTQVVQFIHQSVKDFFLGGGLLSLEGGSKPAEADLAIGRAHHRLSRICIRYQAMEEIAQSVSNRDSLELVTSDSNSLASAFPLLDYATTSWIFHVQQSETKKVPQTNLLDDFGWPSQDLVQLWVRVYHVLHRNSNDCPPEGINMAHIASRYQLMDPLQTILQKEDRDTYINAENVDKRTPLFYAVERGHVAVVTELLKARVDPNSRDKLAKTPLLYAAERGHAAIVKCLLEMKADADARDGIRATALHWAAHRGHKEVISHLLWNGANIEAKDKYEWTPLVWAIESGAETSVEILAQEGIEVNYQYNFWKWPKKKPPSNPKWSWWWSWWIPPWWIPPSNGWSGSRWRWMANTPLLRAVEKENEAIVKLLLKKGARPDYEASDRRSPLSVAKGRKMKSITGLLERYTIEGGD